MRMSSATLRAAVVMASVSFACLALASTAGPSIIIGPYLQNPGPTSVTIHYVTDQQAEGLIQYGQGKSLTKQLPSKVGLPL